MKIIFTMVLLVIAIGLVGGMGYFLFNDKVNSIKPPYRVQEIDKVVKLIDFSQINSEFLFSAEIPKEFEVEYIPQLKAINIYNPSLGGQTNIEKSQVYISFFQASKFLTLSTVNITRQDKATVKEREAILYEITKKDGLPNFSGQPDWRNFKHHALDIRLTQDSPSYFYSFAYNPNLSQKVFDDFVNSLIFISSTFIPAALPQG